MREPVRTYEKIGEFKTTITSAAATGAKSPEEALDTLNRLGKAGVSSFVTEEGDLWIRYWTIAAKGFVFPEHAAIIRSKRPSTERGDELDWLSKNLPDIRRECGGQWIAVFGNSVVDHAPALPELLDRISGFDRPLVTFIPIEPVVWTFTYVH
jgi:hypothetical protein